MSMGPLGMIGSAAGSQLPQVKGSETERAAQDTANQQRSEQAGQSAEAASGVGQTEQDEQASERDADGRRFWEPPPEENADAEEASEEATGEGSRRGRDASGEKGTKLDLSG